MCRYRQTSTRDVASVRLELAKHPWRGVPLIADVCTLEVDVVDDDRTPPRFGMIDEQQQPAHYGRTYSNFSGSPLMPLSGGAIQLAILPGS